MEEGRIHVSSDEGVGWIVIDRPPLNVISIAMARALKQAVEKLDADDTSKIIVLTAKGDRAFGAGADIAEHKAELLVELSHAIYGLVETLRKPDGKPRIAAVKGVCTGGANEIASACDFVVASDTARFAQPEVKIGAVGTLGAVLMARIMSPAKVMELALSGGWLSAEEALNFGMVVGLLQHDDFDQALRTYLTRFTDKSLPALRIGRKHLRQAFELDTENALRLVELGQAKEATRIEDYDEGIDAFFARRPPQWRNR
jgi:enoyl-CoA hydratase/carnithine racemase